MRIVMAAAALLTLACTTTPDEAAEPGEPAGSCRVEGLADLVGQPATQALGADAMRRSGARALRWIRPGDVVTMDYRPDRLNVHLDGEGRVERFACG